MPLIQRIYGLGSIFAKTLRDSRRATILVGGVLGLMVIGIGAAIVSQFATPQSRQEMGDVIRSVPPILQGLAKPVHVLQRGVDVNDIVNMAAIAVIDAQNAERPLLRKVRR